MLTDASIETLSLLLEHIRMYCSFRGQWLFRGQPKDDPLLPRLVRRHKHSKAIQIEREIIRTFKLRARPFLAERNMTELEWLALAQHEGLATRLLDWTDNPLVGLWFAVNKLREGRRNGVLWMFSVPKQDLTDETGDPYQGARTLVFRPAHITPSITAQGGYFTVHKYVAKQQRFIPLEKIARLKKNLRKVVIPGSCFERLLNELDVCGVNEAQLFPGLGGLARHLNRTRLGIQS